MNGSDPLATAAPISASAIKEHWDRGAEPDAAAAFAQHPELLADKSIVLDLAYEEYCLRAEAGAAPEPEAFCARFPTYRSSLRRLLNAHQFVAANSALLGDAPPARWPDPGELCGDFTLLRELGRGAFARVYLATEASTGDRPVAVKFSFEGGAEAQTLGRLNHPNIVPVLSSRTDPTTGLTAVCMPFLGGATLNDVLDRAFPTPEAAPPRRASVILEAARAAAQPDDPPLHAPPPDRRLIEASYEEGVALLGLGLAEALALLHARQVYHLDLKPSNALLGADGRPMLLDFNLSADGRNTAPRMGGTLPYMAPEQVAALVADSSAPRAVPDGRSDLYSLGVILYELLTGAPPFGPLPPLPLRELASRLLAKQQAGCRPVAAAAPRAGRRLATLVQRSLAFDPAARPATAMEVAAELKRFLARRRQARVARWSGGVLLLVIVAAWVAFAAASRRPGPAERGRAAFQAGEYVEAERYFGEALAANEGDSRSFWSRGLTRLKLSELVPPQEARKHLMFASDAFTDARNRDPRPETAACLAYSLSRLGHHPEAIYEYGVAEKGGFQSAALYNDRAFSHICLNELDAADADLAKALQMDRELAAAHYNCAYVALLRWYREHKPQTAAAGLTAAITALEKGLQSPDLYADAARLTVIADDSPQAPAKALEYLRAAVESGKDPNSFATDPYLLKALTAQLGFKELLKSRPSKPLLAGSSRLVIPVTSLTE